MAKTVKKILLEPVNTLPTQAAGKLKVAAYCRVSTDRNEQKTSFDGQVKTYSAMIKANPESVTGNILSMPGASAARNVITPDAGTINGHVLDFS